MHGRHLLLPSLQQKKRFAYNTHHSQPLLPAGDILIHSGDLTQSGTLNELCDALDWLSLQSHPFKIFAVGCSSLHCRVNWVRLP
ncbi:hypothetical protein BJ138DRAFT_1165351 [Hygrophoropsis aurantiaca]|uniref:Uncharacterized protein n=1 Tax=Hygrophoropsis aurantiaca TaxID=72124 RepID=A0ACB7ZVM9_9AGAM|nr:hypothetical protein BJ138DRAFT_1165351 [Hygrophoropsis aurantiaca]